MTLHPISFREYLSERYFLLSIANISFINGKHIAANFAAHKPLHNFVQGFNVRSVAAPLPQKVRLRFGQKNICFRSVFSSPLVYHLFVGYDAKGSASVLSTHASSVMLHKISLLLFVSGGIYYVRPKTSILSKISACG